MPQLPAANISVSLLHQKKDICGEGTDRQEMERQKIPPEESRFSRSERTIKGLKVMPDGQSLHGFLTWE